MKASPLVTSQTFWTTACGLMNSSDVANLRQSRSRHLLICFHQLATAASFGLVSEASSWLSNSCNTSLTLPTIGMSTLTRLEIDDGSMSIWMILRAFEA